MNFWNTNPRIKSKKVTSLIKEGKVKDLLQAIHDERSKPNNNIGESRNKKIRIRKIGVQSQ